QTMALPSTSPAVDVIPTSYDLPNTSTPLCPSTDQRGEARPDSGETTCDIGAYEYQTPPLSPTTLSSGSGSATYGGTASVTATLQSSGTGVSGETVVFALANGSGWTALCGGAGQPSCPTTGTDGVATLAGVTLPSADANAGVYASAVQASFAGDASYAASTGAS